MYPTIGYTNKPGTLTLRSELPMEYSRSVLSNKWYLKRESEPKDRELWSGDKPNLHQATYKMIGKNIESDKISSETESHVSQEQVFQTIKESEGKNPNIDMVQMSNKELAKLPIEAYGSKLDNVLPRHTAYHEKQHLETTYVKDYVNHHPEYITCPKSEKQMKSEFEKAVDNSFCFRRMQSQFTDQDSPKRAGINTFHVQHGEYPNQVMKNQFHARTANNLFNS